MVASTGSLLSSIRAAGLLDAAQFDQIESALLLRFPETKDLARHLMLAGSLTAYQVNQLLQGQGEALRLGPYVLLERLGAGGMGEVFKARHVRMNRIVALKVIRKKRLAQANAAARFRREIEAASKLAHPNIVQVHDAGEEPEVHYLAMELIDGIDLGKLVQQGGPLPVAQACDYVRQAALGLHHAHENGLVHRDVKPQNLLVTATRRAPPGSKPSSLRVAYYAGGTVKVLDMGLVRIEAPAGQRSEGALTQLGAVLGTSDYLAPEQAKSSRVDARADLYGLGCTRYHLLAGQPPFAGGAALDKLLKHQLDAPPSLAGLRPDVPPEVAALVQRLMAKRPEDRPASAAEVATALEALLPVCPRQARANKPRDVTPLPSRRNRGAIQPTAVLEPITGSPDDTPHPTPLIRRSAPSRDGHRRW